jgi:hypothetical protein
MISHWPNHIGLFVDTYGARGVGTTITVRKSYITYCRQCFYVRGVTNFAFYDTVFESSVVAGATLGQSILYEGCHFENIGYDVSGSGYPGGVTTEDFGVWDSALPGPVHAAVTAAYGMSTFSNCVFNGRRTPRAWFQGLGKGYTYAGADSAVFDRCTLNDDSATKGEFFDTSTRHNMSYEWYGREDAVRPDLPYADARKLTKGRTRVRFPGPTYSLACDVRAGKFVYNGEIGYGFTTRPTIAPADGQNEAGDEVVLAAPEVNGNMGYICTVAGNPGTWLARNEFGAGSTGAGYVDIYENSDHGRNKVRLQPSGMATDYKSANGTLVLDDGVNWRVTQVFKAGVLVSVTTAASSGKGTATWTADKDTSE